MTMMKTVQLILKMFYLIWSLFKKKSWFKLLLFKLVRSDRGNSSLDEKEMRCLKARLTRWFVGYFSLLGVSVEAVVEVEEPLLVLQEDVVCQGRGQGRGDQEQR